MAWYPVSDTITGSEPVTLAQVQAQTQIDASATEFDTIIGLKIAEVRAHVERYCNRQFATHDMVWTCDSFDDLEVLPAAPLSSVTSITYVDTAGTTQTLAGTVYRVRADGLEPKIELKNGQAWPAIEYRSRITLTATFGGTVPEDARGAMLVLIAASLEMREDYERAAFTAADALLSNHRRGTTW